MPGEFDVWETSPTQGAKTRCLILKIDCPELVARHKELMDEHEATYDYPVYQPHITLSYDIGDLDINDLPDVKKTIPKRMHPPNMDMVIVLGVFIHTSFVLLSTTPSLDFCCVISLNTKFISVL